MQCTWERQRDLVPDQPAELPLLLGHQLLSACIHVQARYHGTCSPVHGENSQESAAVAKDLQHAEAGAQSHAYLISSIGNGAAWKNGSGHHTIAAELPCQSAYPHALLLSMQSYDTVCWLCIGFHHPQ